MGQLTKVPLRAASGRSTVPAGAEGGSWSGLEGELELHNPGSSRPVAIEVNLSELPCRPLACPPGPGAQSLKPGVEVRVSMDDGRRRPVEAGELACLGAALVVDDVGWHRQGCGEPDRCCSALDGDRRGYSL